MVVASFTDDVVLRMDGYLPWARKWSLDAYRWVLAGREIQVGYQVTTFVTVVGTLGSLFIMSCLAYVMSVKRFKGRAKLAFYVYFTMIFSGGVIPWYLTCRALGLHDNLAALIVPSLVNPWWVFVLRNFFSSLPTEILESARIDGASDARILYNIVLPLSFPAMATVGLFTAVAYWNDWWLGVILLSFAKFRPLSVLILRMINNLEAIRRAMEQPGATVSMAEMPSLAIRMATTVITIGPIILVYPFVQRYFIKGLTVGAVKG
jgi:multiple sugar transport system permease protein/putative aldouronate transport system permease protein